MQHIICCLAVHSATLWYQHQQYSFYTTIGIQLEIKKHTEALHFPCSIQNKIKGVSWFWDLRSWSSLALLQVMQLPQSWYVVQKIAWSLLSKDGICITGFRMKTKNVYSGTKVHKYWPPFNNPTFVSFPTVTKILTQFAFFMLGIFYHLGWLLWDGLTPKYMHWNEFQNQGMLRMYTELHMLGSVYILKIHAGTFQCRKDKEDKVFFF